MQQPAWLEVLRERYRFDEWKDPAVASPVQIQSLSFSGREFAGWRLARQSRRESPGHPPFVRSMWHGGSTEQLMGIDVSECESPAAAREYLLHRLGEFQGPALSRDVMPGVGEVAFASAGETVIVFVRGNAMAVMHNAGRKVEPLGSVAKALDVLLVAKGEQKSK